MKKVLCLMMVFTMVLLVGCNNASNFPTMTAKSSTTAAQTTQSPTTKKTTTPIPTEPTTAKVVIDKDFYQEGSYIYEASDGYKFKISVKISPWILWSESDVLNAVWSDFRSTKSMPMTVSDWGFENNNGVYSKAMRYGDLKSWFSCTSSNFVMYYAVGSLKIENVTQGFDITSSNGRDFHLQFFLDSNNKDHEWTGDTRPFVCRVFYSTPKDIGFNRYLGAWLAPYMEKNTWGPVTFIIAHGDGSTPNNPNGIYRELLETYILDIDHDIEFNMKMHNP